MTTVTSWTPEERADLASQASDYMKTACMEQLEMICANNILAVEVKSSQKRKRQEGSSAEVRLPPYMRKILIPPLPEGASEAEIAEQFHRYEPGEAGLLL